MNAQELVDAAFWIDTEIVDRGIHTSYTDLAGILRNGANGSPQPFSDQKEELLDKLRSVNLLVLSNEQRNFLNKLGLLSHIGSSGAGELESILFRNSLDIATAASKVEIIASEIRSAVDRSAQMWKSLDGLVDAPDEPRDEVLIRVVFEGAASIEDLVDFKKWAAEWHDIGRGIAMAVGATPKDIRVVGAQRGSIIIELATAYGIAQVVATTLLKSLEVAEKVLNLKKAALEIKLLKLNNEKILNDINDAAAEERETGIARVADEVKAAVPPMDGEKASALEKSVKKLLAFIEKGGEVDVILPLEDVAPSENDEINFEQAQKLRQDVHRIRAIESEIKLLSDGGTGSDL